MTALRDRGAGGNLMRTLKTILKYLLCVVFVLAGLNHFFNPAFYLKIMPPYLPWRLFLVYLSGFFEMALGVLLLIPAFTRMSSLASRALTPGNPNQRLDHQPLPR